MTKIIRIRHGEGLNVIKDYLIGEDKDTLAEQLWQELKNDPTNVFYSVVITEPDKIECFVLAFVQDNNCVIFQTWISPNISDYKLADEQFKRLIFWCEQKELSEIKMETLRSSESLGEKWGFKTISKVLSRSLEKSVEIIDLGAKDESTDG